MLPFIFFRLLQSLIALAILSVVVFVLARATGDPLHMILPMSATEEDYANARRYLGLDRPYVEQYLSFVGRAATRRLRHLDPRAAAGDASWSASACPTR